MNDVGLPQAFFAKIPEVTESKPASAAEWDLLINLVRRIFKV